MQSATASATVAVDLITIGGAEFQLQLPAGSTILDGKRVAKELLGHPEELQRWISESDILDDDHEIVQDMQIVCSLLPPSLDLHVKIIHFGSGDEATFDQMASVALPPDWTIDMVKDEIALRCAVMGRCSTMRLVCKGLYLEDNKELSQYHVDAGDVLHLIVPPQPNPKQQERTVVRERSCQREGVPHLGERSSSCSARSSSCNASDIDLMDKCDTEVSRTLGRSHLQRCRSLSAMRRKDSSGYTKPACSESAEKDDQGGSDVQPVRPSCCRQGPPRPRPAAARLRMQSSQSGEPTQQQPSPSKPPRMPSKALAARS